MQYGASPDAPDAQGARQPWCSSDMFSLKLLRSSALRILLFTLQPFMVVLVCRSLKMPVDMVGLVLPEILVS